MPQGGHCGEHPLKLRSSAAVCAAKQPELCAGKQAYTSPGGDLPSTALTDVSLFGNYLMIFAVHDPTASTIVQKDLFTNLLVAAGKTEKIRK